MQRRRGRPRKKRLKDEIPADLRKAIRWIEDIYDDYVERMKHRPGPNSKKELKEILEARDIIKERMDAHNKEVLRKRRESEQRNRRRNRIHDCTKDHNRCRSPHTGEEVRSQGRGGFLPRALSREAESRCPSEEPDRV